MRAVYTGHEALTFTDYLDLGTGKTLHAVPGHIYDIAPASGRAVDEVPSGWFAAIRETGPWYAAPEPAAESAAEERSEEDEAPAAADGAADSEPHETGAEEEGTGEGQSF